MAKKKTEQSEVKQSPKQFANPMTLKVGINFTAEGAAEETRIEAGTVIERGSLPARFEAELIAKKQLV